MQKEAKQRIYEQIIIFLAVISICLVLLDFIGFIDIYVAPYIWLDGAITLIFAIDYGVGFYLAPDKWRFFKSHIFDLLAIIPFSLFFTFFRLGRIARLAKLNKLSRLIGLSNKLKRYLERFLLKNGFLHLFYINVLLLFIGSAIISYVEQKPFIDSLWWAIATVTTVGYGDVVPTTIIGKMIAIILMLSGIGTLGLLTSSLTNFFVRNENLTEEKLLKIEKELAEQRKILEAIHSYLQNKEDSR